MILGSLYKEILSSKECDFRKNIDSKTKDEIQVMDSEENMVASFQV